MSGIPTSGLKTNLGPPIGPIRPGRAGCPGRMRENAKQLFFSIMRAAWDVGSEKRNFRMTRPVVMERIGGEVLPRNAADIAAAIFWHCSA